MFSFTRAVKLAVAALAVLVLVGAATESRAQGPTTGTIRLKVVKAGFIVGFGGGSGTLWYQGRAYHLSVGGIGVGTLGIAGAELKGVAYNVHRPSDIIGTYGAAGAGGTFVGGAAVARLQNEKGVVLEVQGVQMGFQVSLGLAGMTITMQ